MARDRQGGVGPPSHWNADELFRLSAARAVAGLPARYAPPEPGRLYNGTRAELVGVLGPIRVLIDVRPGAAPLGLGARQELKSMIDWLNEDRTTRKGGEVSHGVLVVVAPQPVAAKGGKDASLFGPLVKGETGVVEFGRTPGRRVFVFHAAAEYQKRDGVYHVRLGPAANLTGELTDIRRAKIPVPQPLAGDKATPKTGVPVKKGGVIPARSVARAVGGRGQPRRDGVGVRAGEHGRRS